MLAEAGVAQVGGETGDMLLCRVDAVPKLKMTVEYAGTRYSGWQEQKNARTVMGELRRAVAAFKL